MTEPRPSRTAFRVAFRRAAHQLLDDPRVFDDPLALRIIGPEYAEKLRADPQREDRSLYDRGMRAFLCARHRIAEDALARAIARGVRQYVVLGAGFDTFAYRNTNTALSVFEVDTPATQAWKRKMLAHVAIVPPPNLTFVPVDFETRSLGDELSRAGVDPSVPVMFAWLGVTMYLTPDAVMANLRYIASMTRAGGGVVFDYVTTPRWFDFGQRLGDWVLRRRVAKVGEPFRSSFDAGPLAGALREMGFSDVESLDGDAINARYFAERSDRLRVPAIVRMMDASQWPTAPASASSGVPVRP